MDAHTESTVRELKGHLNLMIRHGLEDIRICSHGDCDRELDICANSRYEDFRAIAHLVHKIERLEKED